MASSRSLFVVVMIGSSSSSSYMNMNNNNNNICKFSPIISLNSLISISSSSLQLLHDHEPYSWISRRRPPRHNMRCRDFVVHSGAVDPAGAGAGPPPQYSNWKSWVLGMAITVILPFLRHKFGPFLLLTNRVVDTAEGVAEMIEKTAEAVEKVAEEISDDLPLPEGGNNYKLRDAVDFVETLAKETAKDAHFAHHLIHQVQDVEDIIIHSEEKEDVS